MDDELDELFMHTVTVETFQGSGAYGDTWADESSPVPCFLDAARKRVRDENGDEVVSEATVLLPLGHIDAFTPGSRVHVRGRTALVITSKAWDGDALDLPSHGEVTLT